VDIGGSLRGKSLTACLAFRLYSNTFHPVRFHNSRRNEWSFYQKPGTLRKLVGSVVPDQYRRGGAAHFLIAASATCIARLYNHASGRLRGAHG